MLTPDSGNFDYPSAISSGTTPVVMISEARDSRKTICHMRGCTRRLLTRTTTNQLLLSTWGEGDDIEKIISLS